MRLRAQRLATIRFAVQAISPCFFPTYTADFRASAATILTDVRGF